MDFCLGSRTMSHERQFCSLIWWFFLFLMQFCQNLIVFLCLTQEFPKCGISEVFKSKCVFCKNSEDLIQVSITTRIRSGFRTSAAPGLNEDFLISFNPLETHCKNKRLLCSERDEEESRSLFPSSDE